MRKNRRQASAIASIFREMFSRAYGRLFRPLPPDRGRNTRHNGFVFAISSWLRSFRAFSFRSSDTVCVPREELAGEELISSRGE